MEAGALGGELLVPHHEPTHGVQPLSLTAEGLLRELVEEHRDLAFEYRSPQGWKRCGKWVGGAAPIEDAKTKSRFSLLALWCAQAYLEETGRQAEAPASSHHAVFFQGASLHSHEAGLNEAWDSDDSQYGDYLSPSLCAPLSAATTAIAGGLEESRYAGSIMSSGSEVGSKGGSGGADTEDSHLEAFASASESESGTSTYSAVNVHTLLAGAQLVLQEAQAVEANPLASIFSPEALLAHPRAALARALAMRGAPMSSIDLTQSLAIASLHNAAGVQNPGPFWEVSSAPGSLNTAHKGSRQPAARVPASTSMRVGPTQQKQGSVCKRGWRKCARCQKLHHWNTKCKGVHDGPSRVSDTSESPAAPSAFEEAKREGPAGAGADQVAAGGQVHAYSCLFCSRKFKSQHAVDIHHSRNAGCRKHKAALQGKPNARLLSAGPRDEGKRRLFRKDRWTPSTVEPAGNAAVKFVFGRAVSSNASNAVGAVSNGSSSTGPPAEAAGQDGHQLEVMSASSPVAGPVGAQYTCALCQRDFKSQHAVDVHLSRNRTCRREKAVIWSQGAGHPKRLPQVFKNGRERGRSMSWTRRSEKSQTAPASAKVLAPHRLFAGLPTRLTARNKTQAIVPGRCTMPTALTTSAAAAREERCELCSRRFISKHALRIHLTRNVNCRRKHESGEGKSSKVQRADLAKLEAPHSADVGLSTSAALRAALPILPILPSLPMLGGPGFEQQSEHQCQAQAAGGGTRLSGKRSHLKRQLKVPTKLQSKEKPNEGCEQKTYKKGLFEKRFKQLIEFKDKFGHLSVSTDKTSCFYVRALGGWVNAQRRARKRGELPQHMVHALDTIGFPWKLQHVKDSISRESPLQCLRTPTASTANYDRGGAGENSQASTCSTGIVSVFDAYEYGRGPTGGAYHLSARPEFGTSASGGSFAKKSIGVEFDDLIDNDYSQGSESDLMNSEGMDEDESPDGEEDHLGDDEGEPSTEEADDCRDELGAVDRDEIAQITDPLDFLEDNAESCNVFWGEEA